MSSIPSVLLTTFGGNTLKKIIPEPNSNYSFKNVLSGLKDILTSSTSLDGVDTEYAELINKQMEMQEQMMLVSMVSNIEKTTHETKMAAVRNIRAS